MNRMKVLHIEDMIRKHIQVRRELINLGVDLHRIVLKKNLEDGLNEIKDAITSGEPYDVIITDMYYPAYEGGFEEESGLKLVETLLSEGITTPVIIISRNTTYSGEGIYGSVNYNEDRNWEAELRDLILQIHSEIN